MILTLGDEYAHSDDDIDRVRDLPFELLDELETYGRLLSNGEPHPNDGICLWYDESNKRCKHYELRPSVCREELKCGDDVCRRWRDKYGIK